MGVVFAERMEKIKGSTIRELLKLIEQPDIISFAGGLPAPELFPVDELIEVSRIVLEEDGRSALQYSATEGFPMLRHKIAEQMIKLGMKIDLDNILITNGSQQGLEFSGRIFLDEDDVVICESPSYMGALNAFLAYQPRFVEIPMDEEGMQMDELEKAIQNNTKIKFIYTIPDFQNPTGRTMSLERRKKLIEIANKYEIPVVEDNPYGELRFEGEKLPALKSFDTKGLVIHLGTFSKTFCPGFRMGWVVAEKDILQKYIIVKQGADLQCNTLTQREVAKFLEMYDLDEHVEKIKDVYRKRRDVMLNTMEKEFPKCLKFTYPNGGLFTWVEFPKGFDASEVLKRAILEYKVAFVPGEPFFPNGGNANHCRMNYSNMSEERIEEGVKRLGKLFREICGD